MTGGPEQAPVAPGQQRIKAAALFCGFLVGGIVAIWFSLVSLIGTGRALASGAPLLVLSPIDARALFVGIALLVFAAMMLLPMPDWAKAGPRRRRRKGEPVPVDWAGLLMAAAVICLLLCTVAPVIVSIGVGEGATRRGYRLCPPPDDERRPPMRWVRDEPQSRCPHSRQDALDMTR